MKLLNQIFLLFLIIFLHINNILATPTHRIKIEKNEIKIGLATGLGGLGDRAFNDMQYNGVIKASKKFNIPFEYNAPQHPKESINVIENLIQSGCNVIFAGGGYHMKAPVNKLSKKYPNIIFALLDDVALNHRKNVCSILFEQNEGAFLAGILSAMHSETKNVGIILATEHKPLLDFELGFREGIKFVSKDVDVVKKVIGKIFQIENPYSSPKLAKKLAEKIIKEKQVDIIFQVASASGIGVFKAAEENNIKAIGVDSDQDYLYKGTILTSVMKRLDRAIVLTIDKIIKGNLENRSYRLGLKEGGIELSPMKFTKNIIKTSTLNKIEQVKQKIINREIIVPTVFTNEE